MNEFIVLRIPETKVSFLQQRRKREREREREKEREKGRE